MILFFLITLAFLNPTPQAALDESSCFCKNPADCEVGIIKCSYDVRFEQFLRAGILEAKFVSGDDPSPEAAASTRINIDTLRNIDIHLFAATCNTRNFNLHFSTLAWTYLKPGEYKHVKNLAEPIEERWYNIPFNGPIITKKINSTNGLLTINISCSGKPKN